MSTEDIQREWLSYCPKISSITKTLRDAFKVNVFRYTRTTSDNLKITLSDNDYWLNKYFEDRYYEGELAYFQDYSPFDSGISLHGKCEVDHPTCRFWNKYAEACKYQYVLCIYASYEDYIELFDFGIQHDFHAGSNVFLNNLRIFQHFKLYFKEQTSTFLNNVTPLDVSENAITNIKKRDNYMLGVTEYAYQDLLNGMPIENIILDGEYKDVRITSAEAKCLIYMLRGLKYKEIGALLNISSRTVETHIRNTKKRFNASDRSDFFKILTTEGVYDKLALIFREQESHIYSSDS